MRLKPVLFYRFKLNFLFSNYISVSILFLFYKLKFIYLSFLAVVRIRRKRLLFYALFYSILNFCDSDDCVSQKYMKSLT